MVLVSPRFRERFAARLVFAALVTLAFRPAFAQRTRADSLEERLRRAEAAIAVLQTQAAEQAQGGVTTRSGARVELSGRVMVKAFGNSRRVNNVDNPQFVLPDGGPGVANRGIGMSVRESRLGLAVTVPEALGGSFTGDVDVDFHGGQLPSSGGRTFPLVRLRTARAVVRWSAAHMLVGQESPLISGLNPVSLGAVGTPSFAAAGNLWLWLPQVRFGLDQPIGAARVGVQAAVLAPTSGDAATTFETDYDLAERTSRPFFQARLHVRHGDAEMTRELGCGVHQGWLRPAADRVESKAFACDLLLPIAEQVEVRGEFFKGRALRGLGGGGIGQNFAANSEPLPGSGGWAQLNVRPAHALRLAVGCGADHPTSAAPLRFRNDACAAHAIVRPSGPLFFGTEARRLRTTYSAGALTTDHVTLVLGFEF
jgi:hypothetical protein